VVKVHRALLRALVRQPADRGTKLIEARKLSWYIGALLRADARVRVQEPLQICHRGRS